MSKSKTKYNLPKYICFDIRSSLCSKKVIYDITLVKDDNKRHSTKTKTVYEGLMAVIENRKQYKNWNADDIAAYLNTYDFTMENQFTLQDACNAAGVTLDYVMSGQYVKDRYTNRYKQDTVTKEITVVENTEAETEETENATNAETEYTTLNKEKKSRQLYLEYLHKNPQWFTVCNFPDYQIYSEPYLFTNEYNKTCYTYHIRHIITKKEIKPTTKTNSLYVNLHGINKAIYKLAADTFLHNPNKKRDNKIVATEVHHLNGNHDDNRLENLEHVTKEVHALFHKEMNKNKKRISLSSKEILQMKQEKACGDSIYVIAERHGYTVMQVKNAVQKTDKQMARLILKEAAC